MPNTINVVAAVVDTRQLTLYTDKGTKVYILQGDARLARIVNEITPILSSRPDATAWEVSLDSDAVDTYREYEKQSGGLVRLFRVAKKALGSFFGIPEAEVDADPVDPTVIGSVPVRDEAERRIQLNRSAVSQILAHASTVAAGDPEFNDTDTGADGESTIMAVIGDQMVHNVEALKPQMARALSLGSTKGMDAFMRRLALVASERQHSAQDLLKFLEKGDLPIADDGSIIIYKILRRSPNMSEYVDCHTGKVPQKVGSYVHMEADLVDPDRRVECSNGLHVARRAYLGGFPGDVVVLAKVAPEAVIAVPEYDANKMRVCGYHILFELSDDAYASLRANQAISDDASKLLLGRAIAGDHSAPTEMVKITAQYGGGVVVTPAAGTKRTTSKVSAPAEALSDDAAMAAPAVDPRAVSRQVAEVKAEVVITRAQKAQAIYHTWLKSGSYQDAATLLNFKKQAKVSWEKLGLPELTATLSA